MMKTVKLIKISDYQKSNTPHNEKLTAAELGKLWATYIGNSMSKLVLNYYLQHVDDQEIKGVIEHSLKLATDFLETTKKILENEKIPIPTGFTDKDVNLGAPRLFADEFYLHYLKYTGKAGLSLYGEAIPLMTRQDIKDFFIQTIVSTMELFNHVDKVLLTKGMLVKPPNIPYPKKVDFVKKQNYLNGFFGNIRPLHALEITHLYDNIENDVASRGLLIGFSQVAQNQDVKNFFIKGKEITGKHIEACAQHLHKENLVSPPLLDHLVENVDFAPFSDKLMLFHKIDMFSMKIRSYANGASLNGRRDIFGMYARFLMDVSLYVEEGAKLMIDHGWMEQIPEAEE